MSSHSVRVGPWKEVENHRLGHRVRLVTKEGIRYHQWDSSHGKLFKVPVSNSESGSESDENEYDGETANDRRVPRSQQPAATNRHARDVYSAAAANPPSPSQLPFKGHYDLNSDQKGFPELQRSGNIDIEFTQEPAPLTHSCDGRRQHASVGNQPSKSTADPGPDPAPAARPSVSRNTTFRTSLPKLSHEFALISKGDFSASRNFILEKPHVLQATDTLFLQDAISALEAGLVQYSESCTEKAVLIRRCSELSSKDRYEYLKDLARSTVTPRQQAFERRCTEAYESVIRIAAQKQERAFLASNLGTRTVSSVPKRAYSSNDGTSTVFPASNTLCGRPSISDPPDPSAALKGLQISIPNRHNGGNPPNFRVNNTGVQPLICQPKQIPKDIPKQDDEDGVKPYPRGAIAIPSVDVPSVNGNIEIVGTEGEEEKLDPAYKKRRDARTFFCEGRVFAMLWHENASSSDTPGKHVKFVTTKGRFGEKIFSHIRRMVVVKQKEGYCWCLAINSYGGNGVAKKGFKLAERQAHTIVHMGTVAPEKRADEVGMDKEPIAVDMAPNQVLNTMSRLNFGCPHTVQWNVKVLNVGKVSKRSMPFLIGYWRDEMAA